MYIENPKTKNSGVLCVIPQVGVCPVGCKDCFFQSGRSYLEPLADNLPNLPEPDDAHIFRINDGNDSNNQRELVIDIAKRYKRAFFNTSMPKDIAGFGRPVVLTINPGTITDIRFHKLNPIPANLMFVRFRINMWNLELAKVAVEYYTPRVPVVFTFMAYYNEDVPEAYKKYYSFRKRTMNSYWVITEEGWDLIMRMFKDNTYVYSCGKDEKIFSCARCGNCVREFMVTEERLSNGNQ
jgi:hypothetical protein